MQCPLPLPRLHVKNFCRFPICARPVLKVLLWTFHLRFLLPPGLLRAVLRTRTPFASFLRSTLHLPRPSRPAQPSRGPPPGCFLCPSFTLERFALELGSRARRRVMHRCPSSYTVHGVEFPSCQVRSSALGFSCSVARRRTAKPCCACEQTFEGFRCLCWTFLIPDAGRRNPQLVARLSELSAFLASVPGLAGDIYADHSGLQVAARNDAAPALEPYRPWMCQGSS